MGRSNTHSDDSVSWAMAGTPWILCRVWWVRCGAEPVLVYRRQPGMSTVWSPVLPKFLIFPRRQPLTTLVRFSFILREIPLGPDKKRTSSSDGVPGHLMAKYFAKNATYKKTNGNMFITASRLGIFLDIRNREMGKDTKRIRHLPSSPRAIWWHQLHWNSVMESLSDVMKTKQMEGRKNKLILERTLKLRLTVSFENVSKERSHCLRNTN